MAIWEVVFSGLVYGQLWQNKVHFGEVNGGLQPDDIATIMLLNWVPHMRQFQTSDVTWATIQVKNVSVPLGQQFTLGIQTTGAQSGEGQRFSFAAGVVQKNSGLSGRKNRGRIYIPGIRGGGTLFGQFQQFELANWNAQLNTIGQNFIAPTPHNLRLVIRHKDGSQETEVTGLQMRPILGVMRTRNIAVGA